MTQLAHDCAILRVTYDSSRLFDGGDPDYELWLHEVCEKVSATNRAEKKASQNKK